MTESPSFSAGDNPPVLFSSDFRISGAPEKYEVRARALWLQASWRTWVPGTLRTWEGLGGQGREKEEVRRAGCTWAGRATQTEATKGAEGLSGGQPQPPHPGL